MALLLFYGFPAKVLRLFGLRQCAVFLCSKSDDQSNEASGDDDFLVVVLAGDGIGHERDSERQKRSDEEAEQDSQRNRFHFAREPANQNAAYQPFERGTEDD